MAPYWRQTAKSHTSAYWRERPRYGDLISPVLLSSIWVEVGFAIDGHDPRTIALCKIEETRGDIGTLPL